MRHRPEEPDGPDSPDTGSQGTGDHDGIWKPKSGGTGLEDLRYLLHFAEMIRLKAPKPSRVLARAVLMPSVRGRKRKPAAAAVEAQIPATKGFDFSRNFAPVVSGLSASVPGLSGHRPCLFGRSFRRVFSEFFLGDPLLKMPVGTAGFFALFLVQNWRRFPRSGGRVSSSFFSGKISRKIWAVFGQESGDCHWCQRCQWLLDPTEKKRACRFIGGVHQRASDNRTAAWPVRLRFSNHELSFTPIAP